MGSIGSIGPWGLSGRADPPGPSRPVCRSMRSNRSARPTWPDLSAYEVNPSPSGHAGARAAGRQAIGASADQDWAGVARTGYRRGAVLPPWAAAMSSPGRGGVLSLRPHPGPTAVGRDPSGGLAVTLSGGPSRALERPDRPWSGPTRPPRPTLQRPDRPQRRPARDACPAAVSSLRTRWRCSQISVTGVNQFTQGLRGMPRVTS